MFHMYEGNHGMGMHLFSRISSLTPPTAHCGRAAVVAAKVGTPEGPLVEPTRAIYDGGPRAALP